MQLKQMTSSHKVLFMNHTNSGGEQHCSVKRHICVEQISDVYVSVRTVDKDSV